MSDSVSQVQLMSQHLIYFLQSVLRKLRH